MKRHEAIRMRQIIELGMANVPDKEASEVPTLFPAMTYDGALIKQGTRIHWNGKIKRASVDLWNREDSSPDNAPTLWEDIDYKEGYRIIPAVITATLAFKMDEMGWWGDELYKSKMEGNTHTPDVAPEVWEKQEN